MKKKKKSVASSPAERKLEMQMLVWRLTLHAASTFAEPFNAAESAGLSHVHLAKFQSNGLFLSLF